MSDASEDPLPRIPPLVITQLVGSRAAGRGLAYQREGRVLDLEWDAEGRRLNGEVAGSGSLPYLVSVRLEEFSEDAVTRRMWPEEPGGLWRVVHSRCSCPVGEDCKHTAAALYEVSARAERASHSRQQSEWRSVLRPLLRSRDPDAVPQPLAIRFDLEASPLDASSPRFRREPATVAHLEHGSELSLGMRPMTIGKRGTWIKSGLSWRTFEYRITGRAYEPAQAEALTRIFSSATADRSYTTGSVEHLWLNTIGSPLIWQSLAHARSVGVQFLPGEGLASVELMRRAEIQLDLAQESTRAPLAVRPRISIDGERAEGARPLGTAGMIWPMPSPGPARGTRPIEVRIAPVGDPIPTALQRLLQRPEPLTVPAPEAEDFLASAYPKLREITSVTSSDGSVAMPAVPKPALRLTAEYAPEDRLRLSWSWRYHDPSRSLPLDQRQGARRDLDHEDEVLAQALTLWPTAGEDELLSGADTASFTEHVLDALGSLDHVQVRIEGTRHRYRELDGAPQVRITQQERPGRNDWFDLGFEITVEGQEIPFPTLFRALAEGRAKVMLTDRSYFSLDHPAFDRLRELIAEGEALAEWEPDHQAVSSYQVDLWDDLAQVAAEVEEAERWSRTVGRLRDLGAVPAPEVPSSLAATLRPYQREGFAWLAFLHDHGLGGVLADDMGLGKTLQTLALIAHARAREPKAPPFLVVAPASVLPVWRAEAERFTPELRVRTLSRTSRSRGSTVAEEVTEADLVVTSYTVLRIDEEQFAARAFSGLVLDEAQFVKNRRSRSHQAAGRVSAPFRLAITGTPMENSLEDLWSIMALTAPGLFGSAIAFRKRYVLPIESGEHPERMEQLRRRMRPFLLRRTKELVAPELPEKNEQVITVPLEDDHQALYDSVLQRERKKVLGLIEEDMDRNRFIVFRSLTLLRMLALDPAIVDPEKYGDVTSSKLDALFDRLAEVLGDGHRVLLFSQFTSYLARVAEELDLRGVRHAYLDGSTRDRDATVREFREGDAPVFLISLKAGGFGLTLTEADYVFLLDPWWNPATENQAVDRAHRFGQDRRVMVFRMVAQDTIEEKVLALQRKKAALFDALTDDGRAFTRAMSAEDIRELLG